uniref:Cytochrome C family protein n=1 Tax=Geobacter sp. (strain M21) TaxID=443144 RepID=C6E613_GEOSM
MFRKLLMILVLLLAMPAFANAWYVNAKTSPTSGAGTITPSGNRTYAAGVNSEEFTVTPAPGYTLSRVTLDGVAIAPNANGKYVAPYVSTLTWRYMVAVFSAGTVNITTSVTGNGAITEANYLSLTSIPVGSARTLLVAPNSGYEISTLTASGSPSITIQGDGTRLVTYSNLQANQSVTAGFSLIPIVVANAGSDVTTTGPGAAYAVTLFGSNSTSNQGAISYQWSGPPALMFGSPTSADTTVYSDIPGDYTATLTITSNGITRSDTAIVHVVTRNSYLVSECTKCHSGNTTALVGLYNGSPHLETNACQGCHTDSPHVALPSPNVCADCHTDTSRHPFEITGTCTSCHNSHSTLVGTGSVDSLHYNNITTGMYPASFVTSRAACANCHNNTISNKAIRIQWRAARHANITSMGWIARDFKTLNGCVRCHTTTGFIAYSTGKVTAAWGVAEDKTKEVLTCIGCHSDSVSGAVRSMAQVAPYPDNSFVTPDTGKSNVCLPCHTGTNSGESIKALLQAQADFGNIGFVNPHYKAATGSLYGVVGYHFSGRSYTTEATHNHLGISDGGGACVSCHRNSMNGHTFQGEVTPACATCHGTSLDEASLHVDHNYFLNSLEVLRAQLAAKGYAYSLTSRSFSATDWGVGQAGADTMGAAFNYALLVSEPAAFVHNPKYAQELVIDSIDYLDNRQFDDSVAGTVQALLDSGAISQEVADSFGTYKQKNICLSCHGGDSITSRPMASNGHPTHLSAAYGPDDYLRTQRSVCDACHGNDFALHSNGTVNVLSDACVNCHAGSVPAWNSTARIACEVCHSANPARLPNGVAAPSKESFATSGHGQFGASNQCTICHNPNSSHIAGSLTSNKRLKLQNDNNLCASCHDSVVARQMSTHHGLACVQCHDPHGNGNIKMVRGTIGTQSITYLNSLNNFVDQTTNKGLCQVCHSSTRYYRAGISETRHYTTGCLSCHFHINPDGAFLPSGGACDSCHGYPPAPKNTATSFGSYANWSGARYEDYSGGGGAHLVAAHVSPFASPAEGWTNCTVCHNGGYHDMTTPVAEHIGNVTVMVDNNLRFADSFTVYTGAKLTNAGPNATGSCFNIACHMSPSERWSTER